MVQVSDLDPSLDLQVVSEVTGETYVYNIGDMAWSEYQFLIFPACGSHFIATDPLSCAQLTLPLSSHIHVSCLAHGPRCWTVLLGSSST